MTRALFIPANMWLPVKEVDVDTHTFEGIRYELACRMVEIIYPVLEGNTVPHLEGHVLAADEEGRAVDDAVNNIRATRLFNYPYVLVGDMLLFGDTEVDYERKLADYDHRILTHLQCV